MLEVRGLTPVSYLLSEILTHTQGQCTHVDEFRMSPEGSLPFLKQSLVNPDNHEFDYTLNTVPHTSAEVNTLDEDDPEFNPTFNIFQTKSRKKKNSVDSVSEGVGALNLTATSLPRDFHESAQGRTGSGLADTFATHDTQSSRPRFEYPYERSGGAILPNPAQQSSYKKLKATTDIGDDSFDSSKDYLKGDGEHRCTSRSFPAPHISVKNYGAPDVRHRGKSPSPHAVENYEAWKKTTFGEYTGAGLAGLAEPWQNETSEDINPKANRSKAWKPKKTEVWQNQTPKDFKRKAAGAEASSSSEGSKSPAYHGERRKSRDGGRLKGSKSQKDQSAKSKASEPKHAEQDPAGGYSYIDPTSGAKLFLGPGPTYHNNLNNDAYYHLSGPQQSPFLPGPPPRHGSNAQAHETAKDKESQGNKSGDGGKHKDGKSKGDTQGGRRRRGDPK